MNKVEVCNIALSQLGAKPITSVDTPATQPEQWCKILFDNALQSLLEDFDWSFAMTRAKLDIQTPITVNDWQFDYKHQLPTDLLRIIVANENADERVFSEFEWKREGKYVVSNSPTIYIRYVKSVTDLTLLSPAAIQALASKMAYELCVPITENSRHREMLLQTYYKKLGEAVTSDGQQGSSSTMKARILLSRR